MDKLIENLENFNTINFSSPILFSNLRINILYARLMHTDSDSWNTENHIPSFYELHIPINGECEVEASNQTHVLLKQSRYMLIHPQTYHRFNRFSENCLRLSMAFYIENNNEYISDVNKSYSHSCSESSQAAIKNMIWEYKKSFSGYESMISSYIQQILIECLRSSKISNNSDTDYIGTPAFQSAMQYIKYNLLSDINAEDVAKHCNTSSRHLNRIFKLAINTTISQYIRGERLKIAKRHLKTSNLTLKEIALISGFTDEYILSKTFSREVGVSPKQYRRSKQAGKQTDK